MVGTSRVFALVFALLTLGVIFWPGEGVIAGRVPVRMTVWGMPFEDRLFLDKYANVWEELNPGVRVDYGRYSDIRMKYNAWHARGHGAEVMRFEITWYPQFVERGMLEPLTPYLDAMPEGERRALLGSIPAYLMDLLTIDGEIYALPQDSAQFGLFYNRRMFDEAGVAYPTEDWTWDDLRDAARRLTRRDGAGRVVVRGFDFAVWSWPFLAFHHQAGGAMWSRDGSRCVVNSDAGVRALEFFRTLQADGSFQPVMGSYTDGITADALFAAGKSAMFLDGSWRVPALDAAIPDPDAWGVAPLPRGVTRAVVCGSVLWGISPKSRHKDEGWRLLRWLVDDPQAAEYWDTLRVAPPANLRVLASDAFVSTPGIPRDPADPSRGWEVPPMPAELFPWRAAWLRYAVTPHPDLSGRPPGFVPSHPFQGELQDELSSMMAEFLNPSSRVSPREALDLVASRVNAIIDRSRRPARD